MKLEQLQLQEPRPRHRGKYPTINRTIQLIRGMGLRASYNPHFREFHVTTPGQTDGYRTDSRHDALFTARAIALNFYREGER